jgi:capsular exopolysaccharide synthesis family protein
VAVALVVAVIGAASWWQLRRDIPHYSAQVLLQRHRGEATALGGAPAVIPGGPTLDGFIASELEILRSRSVLSAVVDAVGLRFRLEEPRILRGQVVSSVQLASEVPSGAYTIVPRGDSVVLHGASNQELATAPRDGRISAPGIDIVLSPALPRETVRFYLVSGDEALRELRSTLDVRHVTGTTLIRARCTALDPDLAATVLNTLAAAYQEHSAGQERAGAANRREIIAQQLAALADSMTTAQEALLEYQRESRSLDPRLEGQAVAAALLDAQNDLRTLRFRESLLTAVVRALRSKGASNEAFRRLVALGGDILPGAQGLYDRLQELETERQRLTASRYGFTAQGPQVQVLDSLIAASKAEALGITEESLSLLRTSRAAAEARERELQQRVGQLPEQAMVFQRLQQRVDAVQRIADVLVEKFYEALIPESGGSPGVEVVDPAVPPTGPDPMPGSSRLFFGLLVGFALGVGAAFGLEYLDATVRYPWDAESVVGLPIIGIVPEMKVRTGPRGAPNAAAIDPNGPGVEAFRMVRTTLRFVRADRPQVIAVTSPGPGEGKSMVAVNLALAIRQQTARVLLVDADMRRPVVHRLLPMEREPGLSDVLVGEAEPGDAIRTLTPHNLSVLPAGTTSPNPAELLGSEAFSRLLSYAREHFETVIIDSPPVLSVADATVIAPVVDGTLVVACVNQTHRQALAHAVEQLRLVKGSVLGVLLNRAPPTGAYRRYSYYDAYRPNADTRLGQFTKMLRRRG